LTAAGGIALYKLGAFGFIAVLASVVVMAMTLPKTMREFVVAMISTTVFSICGGAFVVRWHGISEWVNDDLGMIAIGGVIFVCGLPAWVLVRAGFRWAEKRRDQDLGELAQDLAELRRDLKFPAPKRSEQEQSQ
jgi:membrane-associated PAP2 superfamily phosphatase